MATVAVSCTTEWDRNGLGSEVAAVGGGGGERILLLPPGVAPIKPEYVVHDHVRKVSLEYVSEKDQKALTKQQQQKGDEEDNRSSENEPKRKKLKGRNKHRRPSPKTLRPKPAERLCPSVIREQECSYGEKCHFSHDLKAYVEKAPPSLLHTPCPLFGTFGKCPYGVTCRFRWSHLTPDLKNVVDDAKVCSEGVCGTKTKNAISKQLQYALRGRKYEFSMADQNLKALPGFLQKIKEAEEKGEGVRCNDVSCFVRGECPPDHGTSGLSPTSGPITDEDVIRSRPLEKKKLDFTGKLYLAPLTTVGNLPFRRICKRLGADVTCSEMAMAQNLLSGQQSEWALLKRHASEDVFGVQVCGAHADQMSRCAQLLTEEVELDFIDVNVGCPIDLVYHKGAGCGLMGRMKKFEEIVYGMRSVMKDVPLTVKIRTGIYEDKSTAHILVPKLARWGVAMTAMHGRSREQRYTKSANWEYIDQCAKLASPMPFFGCGDLFSYEDVNERLRGTSVSGLMIARGALIKPWLFTEIKEQRHWDISSKERFDILKEFVDCGLEHWGSDDQGVEKTRRFLLEWLSFLCRYIPVGVLERLPQRMNERPPHYRGRDDMETLMASPSCADWVKIRYKGLLPLLKMADDGTMN